MGRFLTILSALVFAGSTTLAQTGTQFNPDSLTRALWHFNETSGTFVHDTARGNEGTAYGTTIVTGRFGSARSFNGSGDYVNFPSSSLFNSDTMGFSIDVWFKTTQPSGIILRRGLTPDPGFMISTLNGHVVGMIGTQPGYFPDALLSDSSTATFNDNAWHLATLVRDRALRKLFLYVDGVLAGTPADDNFTIPLNSNRPLTIGRWENDAYPSYFAGNIDEVRISARIPAGPDISILAQPAVLDFGWVREHTSDTLSLQIRNLGYRDSLRVTSLVTGNPLFGVSAGPMLIPPKGTRTVPVWYAPGAAKSIGDTTVLRIQSNDPASPQVRILLFGFGYAPNLPGSAFSPDSVTRSLWHFDEPSGSTVHDTAAGFDGTASGTTIVPGRFGNARSFNGNSDYVTVPSNTAFDFDTSGFRVDVWFKTTQPSGVIVRRGLAPEPGFMISTLNGHVVGMIGNRNDLPWPNALLSDTSAGTFNDNLWHIATMVRDRASRKLFLYVDGVPAGNPADDNFTIPLNSARPLTFGSWEAYPASRFAGFIDEVRISGSNVVRGAVKIQGQPARLDFGWVRISSKDTLSLQIMNSGYRDSLHVTSISSNNSHFSVPGGPIVLLRGATQTVSVSYAPTASQIDTGTISIASNDPSSPFLRIGITGHGYSLADKPTISSIQLVPDAYGQARIAWFRSKYDTLGAVDPVSQYSVWERVPATGVAEPTWDFIKTAPAIGLDKYSLVVQVPYPNSGITSWQVFMVVAQTRSLAAYSSAPDSIQGDPVRVTGIDGSGGNQSPKELTLNQNYPNPFNPSTVIRYGLPAKVGVTLVIYNTLGQAVASLVDGMQEAGFHEVRFDGANLASGVYFSRLKAGQSVRTSKILLIR